MFCYLEAAEKKEKAEKKETEKDEQQRRKEERWKKEMEKVWKAEEKKAAELAGFTKIIMIIVGAALLLITAIVTGVAYRRRALCFESSSEAEDKEATGQSPLLKNANYSSRVSPSRTTTASTSRKSRPSSTTLQLLKR